MFSYFDYIVYDMFGRDNNQFLNLLQPHRNVRVVDQLLYTRHMWSQSLNELSTDEAQLENILMQINYDVAKTYLQYTEKPQENRPFYFLREFRSYQFSNFMDSGRQYYRDKLESLKTYKKQLQDEMIENTNNIDVYSDWIESQIKVDSFKNVSWEKPRYQEVEKNIKDFVISNSICAVNIQANYEKITLVSLDASVASRLQNTSSWKVNDLYTLTANVQLEKIKKVVKKINQTKKATAPVALKFNNAYYLISDDDLLMIYYGLKLNSYIAIFEL